MAGYNFDLNVLVKGLGGVNQLSNSINRLERQGATLANTFKIVRAALLLLVDLKLFQEQLN
jgi:hypothetical protein